ncbi:MAG: acyltransferase [Alloprevotella sp.]|nr:1-acyl-sn-glycerol-3-phosphate acyltransferase [Bacteroidales bacterium]MCI6104343.1 1-acyl-sn-glycerol-3-phosphate acyltransferase [Bacteroidales bacterium]MCI7646210.1 1-acyl-sn-glycerol-3-phosphate acyltransferase [Bacteroidales bacterium]MDY2605083.1 acyltransferase [Alloprevotella sp.]MDY6033109.1 acyltransferase [Alloprevotella sp.]
MKIPAEFDSFRPYEAEEMPAVIDRLFAEPQFCQILGMFFKDVPLPALQAKMKQCGDTLALQKNFIYSIVKGLVARCSKSLTMNHEAISAAEGRYTFVSNHRDIVLDSALLDVLLVDNGFATTAEIAIGDNLLGLPWIEPLVRLNKSFIVRRSAVMREMLHNSLLMSRYMHFAIAEKGANIWIAQREGRAKDSDDRTQESLLKMMAMGGEGTPLESLKALRIVPLAISYEYDPCDFLKAKEFQQKRDDAAFKKSRQDDLDNMQTGIMGYKGHIHYEAAPCINTWIDELADLPKAQFFTALAQRMDREIHRRYRLYPTNCIAADLLDGDGAFADRYTREDREAFEHYVAQRVALIDLPNKDEDYLRERILTMYANPARNQRRALEA